MGGSILVAIGQCNLMIMIIIIKWSDDFLYTAPPAKARMAANIA